MSPLTWSQATYIATAQRILRRLAQKLAAAGAAATPYLRQGDWLERLYAQTCDSIHGICKIYREKLQIPLNPPFQRGTLIPPFEKGGQGGFFILGGETFVVNERLPGCTAAYLAPFCCNSWKQPQNPDEFGASTRWQTFLPWAMETYLS